VTSGRATILVRTTLRVVRRFSAAATAAVLVLLAGVAFALLSPAEYRANSTLVVLPAGTAQTPEYYDTLSQGQVSQTFAEVLQLGAAKTTKAAGGAASASVVAVPDTALITVSATAANKATAERTADAVLDSSAPYVRQLHSPYHVVVVRTAKGTATAAGVSRSQLAVVVPVVALVCAVAVQQALRSLRRAPRTLPVRGADLETDPMVRPGVSPLPQPAR
jgi:capsular polysaccharide biosynthesis protein